MLGFSEADLRFNKISVLKYDRTIKDTLNWEMVCVAQWWPGESCWCLIFYFSWGRSHSSSVVLKIDTASSPTAQLYFSRNPGVVAKHVLFRMRQIWVPISAPYDQLGILGQVTWLLWSFISSSLNYFPL